MTRIWIDADACMGAGTCAQIAPDVFHARHDGTWAVKEAAAHFGSAVIFDGLTGDGHGPDGFQGQARVPEHLVDLVFEAAEECPAECIFVER
ncbi:MAG TPA: ferredoxin [Acidimicrobiia bacterium]|nr:ferredoxin [Acidimicrobiia bacterium]